MNNKKSSELKSSLLLLLTAIVWGCGFVAQSVGMEYAGPFTFTAARSLLAAAVLIPLVVWRVRISQGKNTGKHLIAGGICCGFVLCVAGNLQQIGLIYTTVGKAGFITALYVVFVPVLGLVFKKRVSPFVWIAVILSVIGLYLLCMNGSRFTLQFGDLLELACALGFSVHIMVIDYFTERADGVLLSAIQFLVCGVLSAIVMVLFESPKAGHILDAWQTILYAGALSSGVGYTLQMVGQRGVNPTIASLIMCMEAVVSAIAGWLILGQALSVRELAGCALMFAAIVLAQLSTAKRSYSERNK